MRIAVAGSIATDHLMTFPGHYQTGDAGLIDADGYIHVMTRTDDIINVAGHRLSTGGMEEVLASHPDVAECAVLGIKDQLKGEVRFDWRKEGLVCEIAIPEPVPTAGVFAMPASIAAK